LNTIIIKVNVRTCKDLRNTALEKEQKKRVSKIECREEWWEWKGNGCVNDESA